jgi:hypothetical protein
MGSNKRYAAMPLSGLLCVWALCGAHAEPFVAGVHPSERPAGAPVVTEFKKPDGWYARALHGVDPPYPASLRFLEDQGGWHQPFIRPGMTGPYDIRNWHRK